MLHVFNPNLYWGGGVSVLGTPNVSTIQSLILEQVKGSVKKSCCKDVQKYNWETLKGRLFHNLKYNNIRLG